MTSGGNGGTRSVAGNATEVRYVRSEFVANLAAGNNIDNPLVLPINPGDGSCFPWLSSQAGGFEKYRVNNFKVEFRGQASSLTPGSCSMFIDYDPNDAGPADEQQLLNSYGGTSVRFWSAATLAANRSELRDKGEKYIRLESEEFMTPAELEQHDYGKVFVIANDSAVLPSEIAAVLGKVWIHYDITFLIPGFNSSNSSSSEFRQLAIGRGNLGDLSSTKADQGSAVGYSVENIAVGATEVMHKMKFDEPFSGQLEFSTESVGALYAPPVGATSNNIVYPALGTKLAKIAVNTVGEFQNFITGSTTTDGFKVVMDVVAAAGDVVGLLTNFGPAIAGWAGPVNLNLVPKALKLMGTLLDPLIAARSLSSGPSTRTKYPPSTNPETNGSVNMKEIAQKVMDKRKTSLANLEKVPLTRSEPVHSRTPSQTPMEFTEMLSSKLTLTEPE